MSTYTDLHSVTRPLSLPISFHHFLRGMCLTITFSKDAMAVIMGRDLHFSRSFSGRSWMMYVPSQRALSLQERN